ncbi:hypothetical protein SD51_12185 [Alicyclobacillus tengchongensis]|nr:hypothetical protein SD51_12185 [Alicyclobacillus tengchongensis]
MQAPSIWYGTNATIAIVPQTFFSLDRGDMFVPRGDAVPNMLAGAMATPMIRALTAHSIPVSYAQPKATITRGMLMATPGGGVNVNGS